MELKIRNTRLTSAIQDFLICQMSDSIRYKWICDVLYEAITDDVSCLHSESDVCGGRLADIFFLVLTLVFSRLCEKFRYENH